MKLNFEELAKESFERRESLDPKHSAAVIQNLEETTMRKVGIRGKIVKAAIIAVGITMTIGTGVYASSSLWHPFVAERFGISSDMDAQKELVDDGFVSVPEETDKDALVSTVEDKGIKLELLQTVAGHERAQVYIQATFDEEYKIIDDEVNEIVGERLCTVLIDSSSDQTYILGAPEEKLQAIGQVDEIVDDHTLIFKYDIEKDLKDSTVCIGIRKFLDCSNLDTNNPATTLVEGNWDLVFQPSVGESTGVYKLNQKVNFTDKNGKHVVTLERLEATPTSVRLYIKYNKGWKYVYRHVDTLFQLDKKGERMLDKAGDPIIFGMYDPWSNDMDPYRDRKDLEYCYAANMDLYVGDKKVEYCGQGGETLYDENDPERKYGYVNEGCMLGTDYSKLTKMTFGGREFDLSQCEYEEILVP